MGREGRVGREGRDGNKGRRGKGWEAALRQGGGKGRGGGKGKEEWGRTGKGSAITGTNPYS